MASQKTLAIILGAGPGTGQALGVAFSKVHSAVALLSRNPSAAVTEAVQQAGGTAKAFACDATKEEEVAKVFQDIQAEFPDHVLKVACYNANNPFIMKPFMDLKSSDLKAGVDLNFFGAFSFSQQVIPRLIEAGGGSLLFSGATGAIKGSAKLAAFSPSKAALRSLSQSLAREFGSQGVHIAHVILDGLIDTPIMAERFGKGEEGKRLTPESIAQAYVYLSQQPKDCWTQELDLRPYSESW